MSYKNSVELSGRAGADSTTRYTSGGKAVTTFDLAVGGGRKKSGGEWPTTWVPVKAWDSDQAQSVKKGYAIDVVGRLEMEEWTDKSSGQKRRKLVVVASAVDLSIEKDDLPPSKPTRQPEDDLGIDGSEIPF